MTIEDIPNIYRFIPVGPSNSNYLVFQCGTMDVRYGLMDIYSGKVVVPPVLTDLDFGTDKMTFTAKYDYYGIALYRYDGVTLSGYYSYIGDECEGYRVVSNGRKKGLIDNNGKIILPCRYVDIYGISEGVAIVNDSLKGTMYYFIGEDRFCYPKYGRPQGFHGGYSLEKDYNSYQDVFVNKDGNILNIDFKEADDFERVRKTGTFVTYTIDKYKHITVYDECGNSLIDLGISSERYELIKTDYDVAIICDKQRSAFDKNRRVYGVISFLNKIIIPIEYDYIRVLSNRIILCYRDGKTDYYNMNGNKLPLEDITIYDSVDNKSGLVIGEKDGKKAYYDMNGHNPFNGLTFDDGTIFKNYHSVIMTNEVDMDSNNMYRYKRFRILDNRNGRFVFDYPGKNDDDSLEYLEETDNIYLGKIKDKNTYILVDSNGYILLRFNSVIKPEIKNGLVKYSTDGRNFGLYNTDGVKITDDEYMNIDIISNKAFLCFTSLCVINEDFENEVFYIDSYDISGFYGKEYRRSK